MNEIPFPKIRKEVFKEVELIIIKNSMHSAKVRKTIMSFVYSLHDMLHMKYNKIQLNVTLVTQDLAVTVPDNKFFYIAQPLFEKCKDYAVLLEEGVVPKSGEKLRIVAGENETEWFRLTDEPLVIGIKEIISQITPEYAIALKLASLIEIKRA